MNEFDEVIARLKAAPQATCGATFNARVWARIHRQQAGRAFLWRTAMAAVVLLSLMFAPVLFPRHSTPHSSIALDYLRAYSLAKLNTSSPQFRATVNDIVRQQKADGSWASDHLTLRNLAALEFAAANGVPNLHPTLCRARRYLRLSGLPSLSAKDFIKEVES